MFLGSLLVLCDYLNFLIINGFGFKIFSLIKELLDSIISELENYQF